MKCLERLLLERERERERVIMTLQKENKNRVKLLIKLMDVDDEIEKNLTSELNHGVMGQSITV